MHRREFLKLGAVGVAAMGTAQAAAAALERVLGAGDRIRVGVIGVGGRGRHHFDLFRDWSRDPKRKLELVAACDVWDLRAQKAMESAGPEVKTYRDYRELIARPDLDAVSIATPDHWHARISLDAMKAGKDVYCEKPMTLHWQEAKEVARVARETGRVFQCGAGSASGGKWWKAQDIVREGGIGPLVWSQAGSFRNDPAGDWNWPLEFAGKKPQPGKDLDWDFWLGSEFGLAPRIPYDEERYFRFRKYWDYSGGLATDLLYHSYSHLMIAIGPQFPSRVVASGGQPVHNRANDRREVPTLFNVLADFPDQHTVFLPSTQESTDGPTDLIRGQFASIAPGGPGLIVRPQEPFRGRLAELWGKLECYRGAELVKGEGGKLTEIRVPQLPDRDHFEVWLDSIRTRKQPTLNAETAYRVMVPIGLSVISYRQSRVMLFDPLKEEVISGAA
jgi:predicted dehydrogenase